MALPKGTSELKLAVTGKNARATGFDLAIDLVELAPLCPADSGLKENFR